MKKKLGNKILFTVLAIGLVSVVVTGALALFSIGYIGEKSKEAQVPAQTKTALYPSLDSAKKTAFDMSEKAGKDLDKLLEDIRKTAKKTADEVTAVYKNKENYINSGKKVYAPDINGTGFSAQVIYEEGRAPETVQSAVDFSANIRDYLLSAAQTDKNIISVFFSSNEGFTVFADSNPKGKFNSKGGVITYNPEWSEWYVKLSRGSEFEYTGIIYDKYGKNPSVMCAYPVNDGNFIGSVCVKYALSEYLDTLKEKTAFIYDSQGVISFATSYPSVSKGEQLTSESAELMNLKEGANEAVITTLNGEDSLVSAYKTKSSELSVAVLGALAPAQVPQPVQSTPVSKSLVYDVMMYFGIALAVLIVLMIVLCVKVSKSLSKKIVTPIKRITNGIECVSEGNFTYRVAPDGDNEIRVLADSFNNLGAKLEKLFENTKLEIEEYEKSNGEFNTCLKIQRDANLIDFPESDYFEIFAQAKPAKFICSDFFDCFAVDSTHLGFSMVDTSAGGIEGTFTGKIIKELIKAHAVMGESPYEVITNVNAQIFEMSKNPINASVFFGILEINTGKVVFVNAGYTDPLIKRCEGATYDILKSGGNVRLMTTPDNLYSQESFVLKKGDTLILHSDGITEAVNEAYEKYDVPRLVKALLNVDKKPIDQYLKSVYDDVRQFVKGAPQLDDASMMIIKIKN